ncbi:hypothetical protein DdX_00401 [Ditylenchus destructor]|uniref:Uncharacterized protein n=1 Tax=Ditylenchus destructor TaxID=166010 RepID=A0AAD4NGY6_9BILA|nr:hypothetical protein DdX_00401 [Ditylenchus destructor]
MQHSAERGRPGGDRERVDLKQLEERRRRRLLLRRLIDPAVEEAVSDTRFANRNRPAEVPRQPPPAFRPPPPQPQPRPPTLRPPPQVRPPQRPSQPTPRSQPRVTVLTARQSPVNTQNRPPQPQGPPPQAKPTPPPALPPSNQRLRAPPAQQFAPQNVGTPRQLQRSESPRTQPQAAHIVPRQPASPSQQISRNSVAAPAPSPPFPPVETQSKSASGKTGAHPPGFLPPSNSIIEQLNSADNFMDVAERLELKRLLINRSRRHTEFVVHRQQIMLASTPEPLVPKLIIGPEIPEKFSSIPVKNITKTVWRMPLTMTLQQKLTIMPKDKEKLMI